MYMQKGFITRTNHFTLVLELNNYSKSIATQLFYQHAPIDITIYKMFVRYINKYTDWCPNDCGWGIFT